MHRAWVVDLRLGSVAAAEEWLELELLQSVRLKSYGEVDERWHAG